MTNTLNGKLKIKKTGRITFSEGRSRFLGERLKDGNILLADSSFFCLAKARFFFNFCTNYCSDRFVVSTVVDSCAYVKLTARMSGVPSRKAEVASAFEGKD